MIQMKRGHEAPKNVLTLEDFEGIENTEQNRAKFLEYPDSTLKNLEIKAAGQRKYKIADFIRNVLADKAEKVESLTESSNSTQEQLVDAISKTDDDPVKTDGKFINLWKKQQEFAKKIEDYFEEHKIRNVDGTKKTVNSKDIRFYNDTILVDNTRDNHIFKVENGEIEEIPLIQNKIYENRKIRNIYRIGDYFLVVVCCTNEDGSVIYHNGKEESLRFVIDEDGDYPMSLGEQNGNLDFELNSAGIYEYTRYLPNDKMSHIVFDKNMNRIATFEDDKQSRYHDVYYDGDVYICSRNENGGPRYLIFSKNQIIGEGKQADLKSNEYMQRFFKNNEEKKTLNEQRTQLSGEMDINHCKRKEENHDNKSDIHIYNGNGTEIYSIIGVKGFQNDLTRLVYYTDDGYSFVVTDWEADKNILFIRTKNPETDKYAESIFINKTTGKQMRFTGFEGRSSYLDGNLILSFYNDNCAKIYDNNMEYIGDYDTRYNNYGSDGVTHIKRKEKNGEFKYFIASNKSGKIITEYDGNGDIARYRGDNNTLYLIVNIPGKGLSQVKIEQ